MRSSDEQQFESGGGNDCSSDETRGNGNGMACGYGHNQSDTLVGRDVPILYSTNRGLYLRLAKNICSGSSATQRRLSGQSGNCMPANAYEKNFCDLERWSTNRAHTVSLHDTFSITHHTSLPVATSDSDYRRSSKQSNCNTLALFRCNYTSFDT